MSELKVCESCEWGCEQTVSKFLKCLLTSEEKGLYEYCDRFKKRCGEHITI